MFDTLLLFSTGLLTGIMGPLLGIGGGILMIPLLNIVAGYPMQVAIGLSAIGIICSSISASRNNIANGSLNPVITIKLAIPATLAGFLGGQLSLRTDAVILQFIFAAFLLSIIVFLLLEKRLPTLKPQQLGRGENKFLVGIIFLATFLGSMVGVGGGSVMVPILFLLSALSWKESVATSVLILGFSAFTTTLLRLQAGYIPADLAVALLLGIQVGTFFCRRLFRQLPTKLLRLLFMMVISSSAFSMLYSGFKELL